MSSTAEDVPPIDRFVDWEFAVRTAARLGRSGPAMTRPQVGEVVAELRRCAELAPAHVHQVTGTAAPPGGEVLVVDRVGWARANTHAFRALLEPVVAEAFARRPVSQTVPGVASRVTGAEVGALLGFLSSRVLGQYDAFSSPGRLLLVAPTIVEAERELAVPPSDFRLWVCLHEETHRWQFTATPWLAEYLLGAVRSIVGELLIEPGQAAEHFLATLRGLPDALRSGGVPLLELFQSPQQRERLAVVTAVMSLLEGHADVVMDDVGPRVVPSVALIRERFAQRRAGRGGVDRLLRRLLGLEAKSRQYADGARFVRAVVERVGMAGFNEVWREPATLPAPREIADPAAWVRRVHG
jgi:coenzyme F420 biosynthesis associated uncharacterized protein